MPNFGVKVIETLGIVIAFFMAIKLDALIAKWVAYFMIAWENMATSKAKAAYEKSVIDFRNKAFKNPEIWKKWRENTIKKEEKP